MTYPIRDYFQLMSVGSATPDPSIPFDNDFHLLGLDESESDHEIAQKAKAAAADRATAVDRRGQAHANKRLDISLRAQISQAGARFDGSPSKVAEYRGELHRLRERRLKDFAKSLCDSGKWTEKEGGDILEVLASTIGTAPDKIQTAVSSAVQTGKWASSSSRTSSPTSSSTSAPSFPPTSAVPIQPGHSVAVGNLTFPLWFLVVVVGLAIGLIDGWAGLVYGLSFLFLAIGKANAERRLGAKVMTAHIRWGAINAAIASLPLVAMLFLPSLNGPASKWAGQWNTNWGPMIITLKGTRVTANYESPTGAGRAELAVTNERQLDGSWCRESCTPPNDTGHLRLLIEDNGKAFKGWYTIGLDSEIKQENDSAYEVKGKRE